MDTLASLVDLLLHVDQHLDRLLQTYGSWTYGILFAVIFMETGLVITPLLPGDSLLFAAGMFSARGALNPHLLFGLLVTAAVCGDNTNYWIGRTLGPKVLTNDDSWIFKKKYLDKTHAYFEKYGPMTVVVARFVPIVRTFAPFVAGVGAMSYPRFLTYSVSGGCLWVGACVYAGYFLGNIPVIRDNFEVAVLVIIAVSLMPMVIHAIGNREPAPAKEGA